MESQVLQEPVEDPENAGAPVAVDSLVVMVLLDSRERVVSVEAQAVWDLRVLLGSPVGTVKQAFLDLRV